MPELPDPTGPAAVAGAGERFFAGLRPLPPGTARSPETLAAIAVRRFLRARGRTDTLRHVSRVACAARPLARREGLPLLLSDLACTAHDMAAVVPRADLIPAAQASGVPLSAADRAIPQVIHGPLAAAALDRYLGPFPPDLLDAIRYHTTLRAGASRLEMLVFVADKLAFDPTTPDPGFYPPLRAALERGAGLEALASTYLDWVIAHRARLGWRLHPNLLAAHAWLEERGAGG